MVNIKLSILLIDDDFDLHRHINERFGNKYIIYSAYDEATALAYLSEGNADLVICDLVFGGKNLGLDTIQRIKLFNPDISIIVLTSVDEMSSKITCLQFGVDDYIIKSNELTELELKIHNLKRRKERMRGDERNDGFNQRNLLNRMENVIRELVENQDSAALSDFSVDYAAQRLLTTPRTLQRKLRNEHNLTFTKAKMTLFLRLALPLVESDEKISDISKKFGFSSPSHFTKTFHQHFGCTPSEYKKRSKT